ncbi:uncharacterized protein LOC101742066 [Bombyx mori]|uniref:Uncharacterized protein n=1 Tax=Bombyx mori TaxID=7091 RepID=A0A8R2APA4_BOMMO|nr:uncharacterized protein LOC101742066 [Bombyx mori]
MPENSPKMARSASPVARAGAGDISERELFRERHNLQTTPPARLQRLHPKKQLFLTPVNKFTAKKPESSVNLARIKSCLDEYRKQGRPPKIGHKAASMEDLTPTKRSKIENLNATKKDKEVHLVRPALRGIVEERAAARVGRFMLVTAWRRRRDEVRCLRKTLEFQVSCSERLRMQVSALKSLLDSDNVKVRLAMRELDRLKQLLKDKDIEKAVLEREKRALEEDVIAAEDKASQLSIDCRNARNELQAAGARADRTLAAERARRDRALRALSLMEQQLVQRKDLLSTVESQLATLRREAEEKQKVLEETFQKLEMEQLARECSTRECSELSARVSMAAAETCTLRRVVEQLKEHLTRLELDLKMTREQLDWWPRPLTKMLGVARSWLRCPMSMPEALLWSMLPARSGC